jgi:hypothetical protein
MSASEHDPLDELRRAWRGLETPTPTSSDDVARLTRALAAAGRELTPPLPAVPDATTRAAIEWMRDAIEAAGVPPSPPLPAPRASAPLRLALAASLAAGLVIAGLTLTRPRATSPEPAPLVARASETPTAAPLPEPHVATGHSARITTTGIELRSGPVRLVFLQPPTTRTQNPK